MAGQETLHRTLLSQTLAHHHIVNIRFMIHQRINYWCMVHQQTISLRLIERATRTGVVNKSVSYSWSVLVRYESARVHTSVVRLQLQQACVGCLRHQYLIPTRAFLLSLVISLQNYRNIVRASLGQHSVALLLRAFHCAALRLPRNLVAPTQLARE